MGYRITHGTGDIRAFADSDSASLNFARECSPAPLWPGILCCTMPELSQQIEAALGQVAVSLSPLAGGGVRALPGCQDGGGNAMGPRVRAEISPEMARAQVAGHPFFCHDRVGGVFGELPGAIFQHLLASGNLGIVRGVARS